MANVNNPYGFSPTDPNARMQTYSIASGESTAINIGDPVKLTGTGTTSSAGTYATIVRADAGDTVVGVFLGCNYVDSNGQPQQSKAWPASTTATNIEARVADDPNTEFSIQCSAGFALTDFGNKADFVAGSGSLGISGYQLDSATIGTGDNLQIRRFLQLPTNSVGTNAQVIVAFREHTYCSPFTAV